MTRFFQHWADDEGLGSAVLARAVREVEDGLSDGDLGGGIIEKRVRVPEESACEHFPPRVGGAA